MKTVSFFCLLNLLLAGIVNAGSWTASVRMVSEYGHRVDGSEKIVEEARRAKPGWVLGSGDWVVDGISQTEVEKVDSYGIDLEMIYEQLLGRVCKLRPDIEHNGSDSDHSFKDKVSFIISSSDTPVTF